ncbi:hypothetical protein E2C01_088740 [Portunus trituberculatus]|uniref:Uncharacterized protein n=1 Tax=Portunus trituberculatus TaxID=210409 RepID=A0A5B7JHB0_PORTR|nr:hypothetical protein [Portunus trituberculatus]
MKMWSGGILVQLNLRHKLDRKECQLTTEAMRLEPIVPLLLLLRGKLTKSNKKRANKIAH